MGNGVLTLLGELLGAGFAVLVFLFLVFLLRRDWKRFRARRLAARTARAQPRVAPPRVVVPPKIATPQPRPAPQGRCPFCHEDVGALACVVCAMCLARHHDACWDEGGACGACRSTERYGRIEEKRDRVQGT